MRQLQVEMLSAAQPFCSPRIAISDLLLIWKMHCYSIHRMSYVFHKLSCPYIQNNHSPELYNALPCRWGTKLCHEHIFKCLACVGALSGAIALQRMVLTMLCDLPCTKFGRTPLTAGQGRVGWAAPCYLLLEEGSTLNGWIIHSGKCNTWCKAIASPDGLSRGSECSAQGRMARSSTQLNCSPWANSSPSAQEQHPALR